MSSDITDYATRPIHIYTPTLSARAGFFSFSAKVGGFLCLRIAFLLDTLRSSLARIYTLFAAHARVGGFGSTKAPRGGVEVMHQTLVQSLMRRVLIHQKPLAKDCEFNVSKDSFPPMTVGWQKINAHVQNN